MTYRANSGLEDVSMRFKSVAMQLLGSVFALLICSQPALAAKHEPSGISFPDQFEGMPIEPAIGGKFEPFARSYTYQNGPDRIELYVIKPAHPNASIWFKDNQWRAERLLSAGHPQTGVPEAISVRSSVPNGLKAPVKFGAHYKSAALATIGINDWVINVLSVSKTLSQEEQEIRLNRLLEGIQTYQVQQAYPPIVEIKKCGADANTMYYFPVSQPAKEKADIEESSLVGLMAVRSSEGAMLTRVNSIGKDPAAFCWDTSESGKAKWFRPNAVSDEVAWFSTVEGVGWTIECWKIPQVGQKSRSGFALINNDFERAVAGPLYDELPHPALVRTAGMLALITPPQIAFVKRGSGTLTLVDSK